MSAPIALAPRLDLGAAAPLHDALAAQSGDIRLDARAVEVMGGLCLQILLACGAKARKAGHSLTVDSPSPAMTAALQSAGLTLDDLTGGAA